MVEARAGAERNDGVDTLAAPLGWWPELRPTTPTTSPEAIPETLQDDSDRSRPSVGIAPVQPHGAVGTAPTVSRAHGVEAGRSGR